MNKYALKTHKPFGSRIEKKVIIGGETDFCTRRFGYYQGENGLTPATVNKMVPALIFIDKIIMTYWMPACDKAVFATSDGKLYTWKYKTNERATQEGTLTENTPTAHSVIIDGEYYCAVVSGNKIGLVSDKKSAQILTIPVQLAHTVMFCGRLFGIDLTDGYMLRWSGYSLQDWTEGVDGAGYVRLNPGLGKLLNLFVLGDKIVIVRENGLTTVTTLGDSRHMRAYLCDKHDLRSVCVDGSVICGGKLWINTENGIYVYDGNTLTKAPFEDIMSKYVLSNPKSFGNKYIYYDAKNGGTECIMMYDTETGACTPCSMGCYCPFLCGNQMYAFANKILVTLESEMNDSNRIWLSRPFVFDEKEHAVLKSLTVEGSGNFTVEADFGGCKIRNTGAGIYRFSECGQSFTFKVTGLGTVTSMIAEWEVRK